MLKRHANPHRGEVSLMVGGELSVLRPTFQGLVEIEESTCKSLVEIAALSAEWKLPISDVLAVCVAGAGAAGVAFPVDKFADFGLLDAQKVVFKFCHNALTGGSKPSTQSDDKSDGVAPDSDYPIRKALEIATGVLGWTPEQFWAATPHEYMAALVGFGIKHGSTQAEQSDFAEFRDSIREAEGRING